MTMTPGSKGLHISIITSSGSHNPAYARARTTAQIKPGSRDAHNAHQHQQHRTRRVTNTASARSRRTWEFLSTFMTGLCVYNVRATVTAPRHSYTVYVICRVDPSMSSEICLLIDASNMSETAYSQVKPNTVCSYSFCTFHDFHLFLERN
jgi:hypothetical protein